MFTLCSSHYIDVVSVGQQLGGGKKTTQEMKLLRRVALSAKRFSQGRRWILQSLRRSIGFHLCTVLIHVVAFIIEIILKPKLLCIVFLAEG